MDWLEVFKLFVLPYWQIVIFAAVLTFFRAWSTFYYKKFFGWKRFVIRNLILKEFRLGTIPEFLILSVGACLIPYNFVMVEASLLALLFLLSGTLTFRTGRLNLPVV